MPRVHESADTRTSRRSRFPAHHEDEAEVDVRPVTDRGAATSLDHVSLGAVASLQRMAGNAAVRLLVQRLCVEDAAPSGEAATGTVQLPPPPTSVGPVEAPGVGLGPTVSPTSGNQTTNPTTAGGGGAPGGGAGPTTTSSTGTPTTHRTVRRGSSGPDVADLQGRLNAAGSADPALETDGIFGPLTDAAVRRYQTAHSLVPDGIVGPLTWGALDAGGGGGGGGGEGPEPVTDPLAGIVTIVGHGASAGAVSRAREQALELYGSIAPANRARMQADPITIDVIPADKKLTELAEYAHLAGTNTFDGRLWDDVRGIQTEVNGVRRVAVAEEDLTTVAGKSASYGSGFLEAHEGGHGLQFSGLTVAQQAELTTIYQARLAASGPITQTTPAGPATEMWLSPAWYSAANQEEYFANSVAAYHGHPYTDTDEDRARYTRSWLQTNDAPMFTLLEAVYNRGSTP